MLHQVFFSVMIYWLHAHQLYFFPKSPKYPCPTANLWPISDYPHNAAVPPYVCTAPSLGFTAARLISSASFVGKTSDSDLEWRATWTRAMASFAQRSCSTRGLCRINLLYNTPLCSLTPQWRKYTGRKKGTMQQCYDHTLRTDFTARLVQDPKTMKASFWNITIS